jgi:divinyl protochlorophyllide a 8-vinyl-reductase
MGKARTVEPPSTSPLQPAVAVALEQGNRIGPNAIVQTALAVASRFGRPAADEVLAASGTGYTLEHLPEAMIPEAAFRALAEAVIERFGQAEAESILRDAGYLTAEYVLANRIPAAAQRIIRATRRAIGPWLLLRAIGANAGTFGESGTFGFDTRPATRVRIANRFLSSNRPAAAAICRYNQGAFRRLFESLIDRRSLIVEETCQARGDAACTYRIERGTLNVR